MQTTIDKAGRLVIPAAFRKRLGLEPGTQLEIRVEGFSLRLVRAAEGPEVIRRHGRMVARPRVADKEPPTVDIAALIEEERDQWPD